MCGYADRMDDSYPPVKRVAWRNIVDDEYRQLWDKFYEKFGFDRSRDLAEPVIVDPTPSLTFDLGAIPSGPELAAAVNAIEAESLRCFISALPDVTTLFVLDWQHPAYELDPRVEVLDMTPKDPVDGYPGVYPDGDYYAYLTPDLTEGTFGHPWEPSLCVIGTRLIETLGRSLSGWLPIKRANGFDVTAL